MIRIDETLTDSSVEVVAQIVAVTRPVDVRVDEVAAGPVNIESQDDLRYDVQRIQPGFALVDNGNVLLVRLQHVLVWADGSSDEEDPATTNISVVHIVTFKVDGDVKVSAEAVSAWIETNVYFIVYPYVRQFFSTMSALLGLPPIVLGYMHRDELPYSSNAQMAVDPAAQQLSAKESAK